MMISLSEARAVLGLTVHHDPRVAKAERPRETRRRWIAGLAITLTTIISYMAFWHLAPVATFLIGCAALVACVIAFWIAGGARDRPSGK